MKRINSMFIYEYDNKYYNNQSRIPKKMHGLYIVDGIMQGYWEGKKIDLDYPNEEYINTSYDGIPKDIYPSGDVIFEEGTGIYMEFTDRDGETLAYYDFIDCQIKRF